MQREIAIAVMFVLVTLAAAWVFRFQPSPTGSGTVLVNRVTGTYYLVGEQRN